MRFRMLRRSGALVIAVVIVCGSTAVVPAAADTDPPAGTPATVSADALPTVQQNGVVWSEVTVGNVVYATGDFSETWPAGASQTAANETPRGNLLAFDITTGDLITSFDYSLNAQGLTVTASPNGKTVYVGGDFTTVTDGSGTVRACDHIAAFTVATGQQQANFCPKINGTVEAIAATNSVVYVGGNYTGVGGTARTRLAAFNASNAGLRDWAPTADNIVDALLVTPDGTEVVVGGRFTTLTNSPTKPKTKRKEYGLGAVGALGSKNSAIPLPYAINGSVRDYGTKCGITNLSTDGTQVYGGGFAFGCGNFEGTFAVQPDSGTIVWIDDCHGDTYGTLPEGQVLYSVSHAHDCSAIGDFPDTSPRINHHALAETTYATGHDIGPDDYRWNYNGIPDSTLLHWFPLLQDGTVTGQDQAAWAITGNRDYIALGGEFPTANGTPQAGLVRYAIPSLAPDKVGPVSGDGLTPTAVSTAPGSVQLTWQATWDYDNADLTYTVKRIGPDEGGPTVVDTVTQSSNFWTLPQLSFTDTGLTPGASYSYYVVATDPDGNSTAGSQTSVTVASS